jgi:hypothetical protein
MVIGMRTNPNTIMIPRPINNNLDIFVLTVWVITSFVGVEVIVVGFMIVLVFDGNCVGVNIFTGWVEVSTIVVVGVTDGLTVEVDDIIAVGGTVGTVWKFWPPQTISLGKSKKITIVVTKTIN